jgi:hypothetical protein
MVSAPVLTEMWVIEENNKNIIQVSEITLVMLFDG